MTAVAERLVIGMTTSAEGNELAAREVKSVSCWILNDEVSADAKGAVVIA